MSQTNAIDLWPGIVFGVEQHPHAELGEKLFATELELVAASASGAPFCEEREKARKALEEQKKHGGAA